MTQQYEITLPEHLGMHYKLLKSPEGYAVHDRGDNALYREYSGLSEAENYQDAMGYMESGYQDHVALHESATDYNNEEYLQHIQREANWPTSFHPDGCFFCGSQAHPSDCCSDRE